MSKLGFPGKRTFNNMDKVLIIFHCKEEVVMVNISFLCRVAFFGTEAISLERVLGEIAGSRFPER